MPSLPPSGKEVASGWKWDTIKIFNFLSTVIELKLIHFYYECKHYPLRGFSDENPKYKIDCYCRKPRTGLLQKAIHDHNIDISNSIFSE